MHKKNYNFIVVDQHQYFDGKVECFFLIVFQDAIIRTLTFKNANIKPIKQCIGFM